jgi:multidrug resistance protein MdtO
MQTSPAIARDRVVGILLGLVVMWIVFDRLWRSSAAVGMFETVSGEHRHLYRLKSRRGCRRSCAHGCT